MSVAMKPGKFISHYERMLGRPLTSIEIDLVLTARIEATGKRDAVKAMRTALLGVALDARLGYRNSAANNHPVPAN